MPIRLQKELQKLKKRILTLGTMVEEHVRMAIQAVQTRDATLAMKVIDSDSEIDESEVEVEEECLKLLALHQPVAVDLRFLAAVIKINNDLERIGDQAVNIAQRVATIAKRHPITVPFDYQLMGEKTETMLRESLDALVNLDADLAYKVCLKDDEVDDMNRKIYDKVKDAIRSQPERVGDLINLLLVSRHLERIADLATNIAEEVIYMVEGEISRHKMKEYGVSSQ
jgi:phosphate transport system protein